MWAPHASSRRQGDPASSALQGLRATHGQQPSAQRKMPGRGPGWEPCPLWGTQSQWGPQTKDHQSGRETARSLEDRGPEWFLSILQLVNRLGSTRGGGELYMQSPVLPAWEQRHREQTVAAIEGRCHRACCPCCLGGSSGLSLVSQLHSQPGLGDSRPTMSQSECTSYRGGWAGILGR